MDTQNEILHPETLINEVYILAVNDPDQTEVLTTDAEAIICFRSREVAQAIATKVDNETPDTTPITVTKITIDPPIRLMTNMFVFAKPRPE